MQRFLFSRIEVWIVLTMFLMGLLGFILFGAVILDQERGKGRFGSLGAASVVVAEIPGTMETLLRGADRMLAGQSDAPQDISGWNFVQIVPEAALPGYWLLSRFDAGARRSVIELVRLSDGQVMHEWRPDPDRILDRAQQTSQIAHASNWTTGIFRYFGPFLMPDGDLILKDSASPLFRVDACAQEVWMQDSTMFHHSTESDGAGGFWIPAIIEPSQLAHVGPRFSDDAIAHVAADGTVMSQISVAEILIRHGMQHLIFPPMVENNDPVHLNDIEPVLQDGPFWKAGDLFLSLRHQSMVMLYRPATDEIVWMQQGPWMAQHDVDIIDDHRISVFDNRSYFRGSFGRVDGTSDVAIFDFSTNTLTWPHHEELAQENVRAIFEGLYSVLPNGSYVVEDTPSGRLLAFSADGQKVAEFVNRFTDGKVYQIGWGRYVGQAFGDEVLTQIEGIYCVDP